MFNCSEKFLGKLWKMWNSPPLLFKHRLENLCHQIFS
jgi:hypothetical protein